MREAVIVAYGRSPVCRARKGSLAAEHPVRYGADVLNGVLAKIPELDPAMIDDVIIGCAGPVNRTGNNLAKLVALRAQLPVSVAGQTINRFCSSGLQAIATAVGAITANQADVVVAGGIEDMTSTFGQPANPEYLEEWLVENEEGAYMAMGITAENVAEKCNISRKEMDLAAVDSHRKAHKAQIEGKLAPSIIPVTYTDAEGKEAIVSADEGIRPSTNEEILAGLEPAFIENGRVTAATSSQTSDGAAFVVLMESEKAKEIGLKPIARMLGFGVAGCEAKYMGLGPIYAVPKAFKRAGITVDDLDVIELNEAFAAQWIPCIRELGLPIEKVNPYGGAMALGHPMGATGSFLTCKALDYLKDTGGKYALVTMCIGGGQGAAAVFELLA